jgi:putative ABC transport system permease protein
VKILIRYILSTVFHKPVRFMLVLFTLCLSGAAVFASVSISDTMIKTTVNQWRYEYGYSDIVIKPSLSSPSRYFDQFKAEQYGSRFSYAVRKLSADAGISGRRVALHGYTLDALRQMLNLPFLQELNLFPFEGNKIIVSAKYARENRIRPGDALTADINGNRHQFVVAAICPRSGPFAYENESFAAIIPFEKMQSCLGRLGKADAIYIGLKDKTDKSHMILKLSELYKGYSVGETYSAGHLRLQTNRSAVPFVFMSVLLCLMAVYVIYVIFQNIVIERMPQMGIFRAIGAGSLSTDAVVLLEGAAYGVIGGVLSLGAGALILNAMARHLHTKEYSGDIALSVSPWHIALALLVSIGISVAGGYLSLRKYKPLSIVGLIRQSPGEQTHSRAVLPFTALVIFLASMTVLAAWRSQSGLVLYVLLVTAVMLSFLMASTFLYGQFAGLIKTVMGGAKGLFKIVSLSIQNQRGFVIAATILSVITATNIIINTITYSDDEGRRQYFSRFHYDMELGANDLTRGRINFIEQLPGVSGVCANYYSGSVDVKGQSISIYRIHGIDTLRADTFMDYKFTSTRAFPFERLEDGKSILLTNTLRNIYNVNENDTIVLKIYGYDGIYREIPYKVIGFFDDEYTKLGRYALISHKNFAEDFKAKQYSSFYIMADEVDKASDAIEAAYRDKQLQMATVREMQNTAREESRSIISAMRWISYISAGTGLLGMLFIMLLSFKSRTGELSIYSAMGSEKKSIGGMLFAEMLLSGIAGLAAGVVMGLVISLIALPRLIYSLQIAMSIYFRPAIILSACLFGLGICAVSGAVGVISFRKTTLMGGLRYE